MDQSNSHQQVTDVISHMHTPFIPGQFLWHIRFLTARVEHMASWFSSPYVSCAARRCEQQQKNKVEHRGSWLLWSDGAESWQNTGLGAGRSLGDGAPKGKATTFRKCNHSKRITNSWLPALATTVVILCNDRWPGSWMWSASSMGRKTRLYITWCARCAFFSSWCASFLTSCEDQTMLEVELSECWDVDIRAWLRKYQLVPP